MSTRDWILFGCAMAIAFMVVAIVVKVALLNPTVNRWKR
jgi:hypothetical protein